MMCARRPGLLTGSCVFAFLLTISPGLHGASPLAQAIKTGKVDQVEQLLNRGALPGGEPGETPPLSLAASGDHHKVVRALFYAGADINRQSGPGNATALHAAAAGGHAESVDVLLGLGADASIRNAKGKTAAQVASAAGHVALAQNIEDHGEGWGRAEVKAGKNVVRPAVGTDLKDVSLRAANGTTIILAAGEYTGPVIASGKRLNVIGDAKGKTVIKGDAQGRNAVVIATKKGEIRIANVGFSQKGAKQLGVFVKDGIAVLDRCRFADHVAYGVYVESSMVWLYDCTFARSRALGVAAFKDADIELLGCTFTGGAEPGIYAQENAELTIGGNTFTDMAKNAILARTGSTLELSGSSFTNVKQMAVVAEQSGNVVVRDNRFVNCQTAVAVNLAKSAIVQRNDVRDAPGGTGFYLKANGPIVATDNRIQNAQLAVNVQPGKGMVSLARNRAVNMTRGGYYLTGPAAAAPIARLTDNQVIGFSKVGAFVDGGAHAVLNGNRVIGGAGSMGVSLQGGSSAILRGNTFFAGQTAINFYKTDPAKTTVVDDVIVGKVASGETSPVFSSTAQRIVTFLKNETSLATIKKSGDLLLKADDKTRSDRLKEFEAGIAAIRSGAATQARISLEVADQIENRHPVAFRIYAGDDTDLEKEIVSSKSGVAIDVMPGRYWIVPSFDDSRAERITVEKSETRILKITADDSLWLKFGDDSKNLTHKLVRLRSAKTRAVMAYWLRRSGPYQSIDAMRRAEATDQQLTAAHDAAMKAILKTVGSYKAPDGADDETKRRGGADHWLTSMFAQRVLVITGTVDDFKQLLAVPNVTKTPSKWIMLAELLGRIEARTGTLENGELQRWLKSDDKHQQVGAAIALRELGRSDGDQILRDFIANPDPHWLAYRPAWAMLSDNHPQTLAAMRSMLKQCAAADKTTAMHQVSPSVPGCLYLLAHGNKDDLRVVADYRMGTSHAGSLATLAANPMPLMDYLLEKNRTGDMQRAAALMTDRLNTEAYAWARLINSRVAAADPSRARNAYATSLNTSRVLQTYAFPNGLAIRFYGAFGRTMALRPTEFPSLSSDAKWFLEPDMADFIVRTWNAKTQMYYLNLHHLDVTPLDAIEKAVSKHAPGAPPPGWAMFRHYRQVATRAHLNPLLRLPMGQSRYPYVIRYREANGAYGGGLTGIADMQTSWRDDKLMIAVRFRQESYYHDIGSLAGRIDRNGDKNLWPHHQYVDKDGRKLIHSITVQRGGKKFVAKDTGRVVDGYLMFEAGMDSTSLADLWVNVQLRFLDQAPMQLVESLSWGEQARETRMRRTQANRMAAAATKSVDDAQTQLNWANAALAAGRHADAIRAFKATLKVYPNEQLAINAAKAFEKRNNPDGAIAMLEYGMTLKPGSAAIAKEMERLKQTDNE